MKFINKKHTKPNVLNMMAKVGEKMAKEHTYYLFK